MSNQFWQELLNTIEVQPNGNLFPSSEDQIVAFEFKSGLKLPDDYREFCKFFGSGSFGDIHIVGSGLDDLIPDWIKNVVTSKYEHDFIDANELSELIGMLDSSLLFGSGNNQSFFLDSSHNVYILYFGDLIYGYNFGFGFTSFILNYCLSQDFQESLPEEWRNSGEISKTFYAYQ
jgi:hypothetical protein